MIQPIVNINGTSARELIDLRLAAVKQLDALVEALKALTPNGRDYPGQQDRCTEDRAEHFDRLQALGTLRVQLTREAVAISNQDKDN